MKLSFSIKSITTIPKKKIAAIVLGVVLLVFFSYLFFVGLDIKHSLQENPPYKIPIIVTTVYLNQKKEESSALEEEIKILKKVCADNPEKSFLTCVEHFSVNDEIKSKCFASQREEEAFVDRLKKANELVLGFEYFFNSFSLECSPWGSPEQHYDYDYYNGFGGGCHYKNGLDFFGRKKVSRMMMDCLNAVRKLPS